MTHNGGDSEVPPMHLLSEPLDLATRVAEDDRLRDGQRLVEVTQCVQLPLLPHTHSVMVSVS